MGKPAGWLLSLSRFKPAMPNSCSGLLTAIARRCEPDTKFRQSRLRDFQRQSTLRAHLEVYPNRLFTVTLRVAGVLTSAVSANSHASCKEHP